MNFFSNSKNSTNSAILIGILTVTMISLAHAGRPVVRSAFVTLRNRVRNTSSSPSAVSASSDEMPKIPDNVVQYSQVPKAPKVFTATTIPKGLLKEHTTKKGTWGVIKVSKGTLEYQINEPTVKRFELQAPCRGIIVPTVLHQVKALTDDVEFVVEFHRAPETGPVDEKREGLNE